MPETLMNPATEARRPPEDNIEIGERIPLEGAPNIRGPVGVEISTSRDDVGTSLGEDLGEYSGLVIPKTVA
jgi:hypothetical protein